jgi:hypothetical protein
MKGRLVRAAIVLLLLFVSFPVAQAVDAPAFVQANCYATAGGAVHLEWTDTADTFTLYYHTTDVFAEATTGTVTSATSLTYTPPLTNQNLYFWVEATEGEDTAVSTFIQILSTARRLPFPRWNRRIQNQLMSPIGPSLMVCLIGQPAYGERILPGILPKAGRKRDVLPSKYLQRGRNENKAAHPPDFGHLHLEGAGHGRSR